MARRCPEMLLCSDDWKTNYLATQTFATFKRSHGTGAGQKVKEEAKDVFLDEDKEPSRSSKRKIEDTPGVAGTGKKSKTTSVVSKTKARGNDDGVSKSVALPPPPSIPIINANTDETITSLPASKNDSTNRAATSIVTSTTGVRPTARPKLQLRSTLFEPTEESDQTKRRDVTVSHPPDPTIPQAGTPELPPAGNPIEAAPHPQPALDVTTNTGSAESPKGAHQPSTALNVVSSTQSGSGSHGGGASKGKIMVPLKKRDAKGLCSDDWCTRNPTGTISQFNTYWNTIKDTPAAECFGPPSNLKPASRPRRTTRQSGA